MMQIPVYQMMWGLGKEGKLGMVFPSENKDTETQSILYTIPIGNNCETYYDLLEYLSHQRIYFPFLMGDKYYELEAELNFPDIIFSIPNTETKIAFELYGDDFLYWDYFFIQRRRLKLKRTNYKYVGARNDLIIDNIGFLTLLPIDLFEMNELYLKHKGVFVGLTPNFGTNDNYDQNFRQ